MVSVANSTSSTAARSFVALISVPPMLEGVHACNTATLRCAALSNRALARALRAVAPLQQRRDQRVAMLALDLDHACAHRATRSAALLELGGERAKLGLAQRQPADDRHDLAGAALRGAPDPHFGVADVRAVAHAGAYRAERGPAAAPSAPASATATALMSTMRRTVDE